MPCFVAVVRVDVRLHCPSKLAVVIQGSTVTATIGKYCDEVVYTHVKLELLATIVE